MQFGIYEWAYSAGRFEVALRPNKVLYCAEYQAQAKWDIAEENVLAKVLRVDFKNFGQYEFVVTSDASAPIQGSVAGVPEKWRTLTFLRPFNETEIAVLGQGHGTVWSFQYSHGHFEIEFRTDGYNHFICKDYPAHAHWSIDKDSNLLISWAQYGMTIFTLLSFY
jgi:hypothetical protein